jgi:hypothetical protein
MITYERNKSEIDGIFSMINSGRYYSMTFVKKGDGNVRYLNGHRNIYKRPDGSEGVVTNVGYDPKNYNLIRVFDRNAENPKTGERTGNYRSAALENIIYIKCGNDFFDFVQENRIKERFPHVNLDEIRNKMRIESAIEEEINEMFK